MSYWSTSYSVCVVVDCRLSFNFFIVFQKVFCYLVAIYFYVNTYFLFLVFIYLLTFLYNSFFSYITDCLSFNFMFLLDNNTFIYTVLFFCSDFCVISLASNAYIRIFLLICIFSFYVLSCIYFSMISLRHVLTSTSVLLPLLPSYLY